MLFEQQKIDNLFDTIQKYIIIFITIGLTREERKNKQKKQNHIYIIYNKYVVDNLFVNFFLTTFK